MNHRCDRNHRISWRRGAWLLAVGLVAGAGDGGAQELHHDGSGYLLEDASLIQGIEPAGISLTAQKDLPTGLLANMQSAVRRMLDGKAEISFVPSTFSKFLSITPDEIVKTLPFAHYFSYLFDLTSKLPVRNGAPDDPIVAPFTYHLGDPKGNPHIARLNHNLLVRYVEGKGATRFGLELPDGTIYEDEDVGVVQVIYHTSPEFWKDLGDRLKDWWERNVKGHHDLALAATVAELDRVMTQGEGLRGQDLVDHFTSPEAFGLFWKVFEHYRVNNRSWSQKLLELVAIFQKSPLSETVVGGAGKQGFESVDRLHAIGQTIPFPAMEFLLTVMKRIWNHIRGVPSVDFAWPLSDLKIAIVTRYRGRNMVEVLDIIATSREFARDWHPSFLQSSNQIRVRALRDETRIRNFYHIENGVVLVPRDGE